MLVNSHSLEAIEYQWRGLIEVNYSDISNDQLAGYTKLDSYLRGDYGKFEYDSGATIALSQLSLDFEVDWDNNLSYRMITNAYSGGAKDGFGITESYLKYKGIPDEAGYRYQWRAGIIYPKISQENIATGWSSPYTLNYSMINSWIAEELRHVGLELSVNQLGKFTSKQYDWNASLSLLRNNDTAGALLAWHGWNQHNRQSLWHEQIKLPNYSIRMDGQMLAAQNDQSDPFVEIDDRTGYHINTEWLWLKRIEMLVGYYDNRAKPYVVKNGQYAWHTRFKHVGLKWKFLNDFTLIGQFLSGDTLMQSPSHYDVVKNDFSSQFLMLTKQWERHRLSARIEAFKITDNDNVALDDNSESGNSLTLSHAFKINKHWFLHSEFNQITSERGSRIYHQQAVDLVEQQWQFALRYFF
jgi:hypothetical protein